MRLRIGHLSTVYHTAILLMARSDLERFLGVDVEWKLFGTGPAIVNAFEKSELDLAYIGLPPAIIGISRGVGIVCVAGGHIEGTVICGQKGLLGFPEEEDLGIVLRQLLGKKVGVPGRGSIHDVILKDCLERFRLTGEIEVINFAWADQALESMVRGEISAAVGTPALAVASIRYAGGKILYPPSRLWPHNPSYGIIVEKDFVRAEKGLIQKFLIAHEEATHLIRKKPRHAAGMIADFVGFIDAEFVLDTLKVSPKYCAQLTDEFVSSSMEFAEALKRLGYMSRDVSPDQIFDTSLIKKIHPEKDHYEEGLSN